jgi:acyl dehydratase
MFMTFGSDAVNQKNSDPHPLYLEDLHLGQRFTSGLYHLDRDQIKAFAADFDPQPFHLDEMTAEHSLFRGLAASGWHTAAVTMRLLVTGGLPLACGLIGLGVEIAWSKPVRPGDTLKVESEITGISPSTTKPDRGVVKVRSVTINQNGDQVQALTAKLLVFRRAADSAPRH